MFDHNILVPRPYIAILQLIKGIKRGPRWLGWFWVALCRFDPQFYRLKMQDGSFGSRRQHLTLCNMDGEHDGLGGSSRVAAGCHPIDTKHREGRAWAAAGIGCPNLTLSR